MALVTEKVQVEVTYDSDMWPDPISWDWSELIGEVWSGPVSGRSVRVAAMHLDDEDIPWSLGASDE